MKAKQKPAKNQAKKPKEPRSSRKKLQFEDGVKAALVAAAIICVAVLGTGGFFAVRSVLSGGDNPEVSLLDAEPELPRKAPLDLEIEIPPLPGSSSDAEILPELDEAIRNLEAAADQEGTTDTSPASPPANGAVASAQPAVPVNPSGRKSFLVLVIDDAGNNLRDLDPFLKFPGPVTIAVLPGLANSVEAAKRVRAAGKELFLHQPMEPLNGQDPGPGAIKTGMSPAQVKEILVKNLNEIGPVAGFNNHEGSRITMDAALMKPILEISRDSALIFLDSRTTADTVAPRIARELGITIAERDIFLDNEQDRESILAALEAGCKRAEQNGIAVLIGHAWTPRLAGIFTEMYPQLVKRGFVFASLGTVLHRSK